MFRHASPEGIVSLRAFHEDNPKRFRITPVALSGGRKFLIEVAEDDARRAANFPKPVVFCPPIATFSNPQHARESDLAEGLALSVECDQRPREALAKLALVIGQPTVVVASGGKWTDPTTSQVYDKLHLHWRLRTPARGKEGLAKLKQARDLGARLVGGDPSNKPIVHPIRWPGSWHRKGEPVLCQIEEIHPDNEIDLDAAHAALIEASPEEEPKKTNPNGEDQRATGWSAEFKGIISAADYHGAVARLAMKMLTAGIPDGVAVNMLRGFMEISEGPRDDRWQARYDDIPRAVSTAREKIGEGPRADARNDRDASPPPPPLKWLAMQHWDHKPIPERQWAILNRVPANQAGLFSGHGGTGKSILELTKNVAHVAAKDWLGSMPEPGPAFYIGTEDEEDEIHRRAAAIAKHYGVSFKELTERGLYVLCLLGQDATLCATKGKSGTVEVTNLYRQLYEAAADIKPKNISVDTLSRAFAGNEIDRVEVCGFAMHMQALAMVAGARSPC
jgi:hypothetical protein